MQIIKSEVTQVLLQTKAPIRISAFNEISNVTAFFVRIETRDRKIAWGCSVADTALTGETPEHALRACQACADVVCDLNPVNLEFSLAELKMVAGDSLAAHCAFDLAFYDLLGLISGMPLYRLLGGYRHQIQTSATIPLASIPDSVGIARSRAKSGFRILKIKGGMDPDEDVQRVKAVHRMLPNHRLWLDADGHYQIQDALDVSRALKDELEILEQPTAAGDLAALAEVTRHSPIPVLADQSVTDPSSALRLAAERIADGICVKMATCGGFGCARQIDAIAQAARLDTLVSCVIEPALLAAAGLSFALSSPNVKYCDLDGYLDLSGDPSIPGFRLEEGCLVASDVPGLGCQVEL